MAAPDPALALVAMPWPLLNRPSIQLGALKAYVERETPHRVATLHPYLQIAKALGPKNYTIIAESSWGAEALFAALLFTKRSDGARRTFTQSIGAPLHRLPPFDELVTAIDTCCRDWLASIPWSSFRLIGFTLCFNQLFASLYLADLLKKLPGCPPIVFGGSLCGGDLGQSLLGAFPQIDYIVDGEGEKPLAGLITYLTGHGQHLPERLLAREGGDRRTAAPEVNDLNTLPPPDFTPYFQEVQRVFSQEPFIPVIPVEFSRGCWWNRCSFCNLNLQWCGYRYKSGKTMLAELATLARRHQCLDFTFTDNALPPGEADTFFRATAASEVDVRFFAEIRPIPDPEKLMTYRRGGLHTVQVGIEALSSSLLARMRKGTSAIDNVAMLKSAQAADILLEGNLIMEFPGSTATEVKETIRHLDFVLPFHPLASATFFLGHGSPVDGAPRDFNIRAVTVHPHIRRLMPAAISRRMTLLIKGYRGDRQRQRKLWQPVRDKLRLWQHFHDRRQDTSVPPLSYRDGITFLLVRQEVADGPPLNHRLKGVSREIYLFCETIRTLAEITSRFPQFTESAILAFLSELEKKRLIFREADRVLALALRSR